MAIVSIAFEKWVGFSNGCAELAPNQPPPFVPSCLMAIIPAAGPLDTCTVSPWSVTMVSLPLKPEGVPQKTRTTANTIDNGKSILVMDFTKYFQKFPRF